MQLPGHFLLILFSLLLQHCTPQMRSHCNSLTTCRMCISSPLYPCVWCKSKEYVDKFFPPCDAPDTLLLRGCPQEDIFTAEQNFSVANGSGTVSPSKIFAPLRPTMRQSFEIKVTPPVTLPVDLYMLFDNTRSMTAYADIARLMSTHLLLFMQSISNSSRIGFGTFVDKEVLPFHFDQHDVPDYIEDSYAFRNIRSLTNDKKLVNNLNFTLGDNDDQPEGVLEAIIQAVTCTEEIGWSGQFQAYRILVVMTDAEYHYALDGKLAGIVTPNDLECKTVNSTYVNTGDQDYPTILQFLDLLLHNNILPIIITDGDMLELYRDLLGIVGITGTTTVLTTDLNSILTTVEGIYRRAITSTVPFAIQEADIINYSLEVMDCGGGTYDANSNSCFNIPANSHATYKLEVWLDPYEACSQGHDYPHTIDLHFLAFGHVTVTILPICECNCSEVIDTNSSRCSYNGKLVCGACECNDGFSGPTCNCHSHLTLSCIAPGADEVCSNRGICNCGECLCYDDTSFGRFCECDANNCPFYSGEVCGGPSRGTCGCDGLCNCTEDYEHGINGMCSCLKQGTAKSIEQCTDPDGPSSGLCSGRGRCVCGKCECDDGGVLENPYYEGGYCEICNLCKDSCDLLRLCVLCRFSSGDASCCSGMPGESIRIIETNLTAYTNIIQNPAYRMCTIIDQGGCIWDYAILANLTGREQDFDILTIRRVCTNTSTWWPWVVGAFVIVAVIGIIVIIVIRIIVREVEKREYAKFWESHKRNTVLFTESPLYNPPVIEVDNPGYRKIVSQD